MSSIAGACEKYEETPGRKLVPEGTCRDAGNSGEIALTEEQMKATAAVELGDNVLLVGGAGTGKSTLIDAIDKRGRDRGIGVLKTAYMGLAAKHIHGHTLSSVFKLGKGVAQHAAGTEVLEKAGILIVDELSTVRADVFDAFARRVQDENERRAADGEPPLTQVLVGDFYQLSPVAPARERYVINELYGREMGNAFAFQGDMWDSLDLVPLELTEAFRQDDPEFVGALDKVRVGDYAGVQYIWENCAKEPSEGAVRLLGRNADVEKANMDGLLSTGRAINRFDEMVAGSVNCRRFPEELLLSENARVMLLVNDAKLGFVNGDLGTVTGFRHGCVQVELDRTGEEVVVERYEDECVEPRCVEVDGKKVIENVKIGSQIQFPLKLSYAMTIHKCQGLTLDKAIVSPSCFCPGQLYVALSRVRSVGGLHLTSEPRPSDLKVDPIVARFVGGGYRGVR